MGVPLVMPVPLPLYAAAPPPVLDGGLADAAAAVAALLEGTQPHDPKAGPAWAREVHGVAQAVDTVAAVHRAVVAARR